MRMRKPIRKKEMMKHIPAYPAACSILNLGAHLGYVDKEMSPQMVMDTLERMERKLFWTIVGNPRLVGAEMRTQRSTRLALSELGFDGASLPPTCVYLSIDEESGR